MKVLITGGAGFIGSHLAEAYLRTGNLPKARVSFNQARDSDVTSQILTKADTKAIRELEKTLLP